MTDEGVFGGRLGVLRTARYRPERVEHAAHVNTLYLAVPSVIPAHRARPEPDGNVAGVGRRVSMAVRELADDQAGSHANVMARTMHRRRCSLASLRP